MFTSKELVNVYNEANLIYFSATAIVRSTFEQDFTGSVFQQDPTSTFWWSIVSVKNYIPAQIEIHNTYVYTITVRKIYMKRYCKTKTRYC